MRTPIGHSDLQQAAIAALAEKMAIEMLQATHRRTDRFLGFLLVLQWAATVAASLFTSPKFLDGATSTPHFQFRAASLLGGAIILVTTYLALRHPGEKVTRHVLVAAQMLASALLVYLCGSRIETHFHIFGSLVLFAYYGDWRVFVTAIAVTVIDWFVHGLASPLSMFGISYASPSRTAGHAGWVLFECGILIWSCLLRAKELNAISVDRAELQELNQRLVDTREAVQEREDELRAVLHNAADAILTFNDQTIIVSANRAAELLFSFDANQLVGKNLANLVDSESQETIAEAVVNLDARDESEKDAVSFELSLRREGSAGPECEVMLSAVSRGEQRLYTAIMRDMTKRRLTEVELRQTQKLESIGQLAAGIAHEINTPIQFVGDNARFLQDEFAGISRLLTACEKLSADEEEWKSAANEIKQLSSKIDSGYLVGEIPRAIQQSLDGIERVSRIVRAMKDFSHPGTTEKQAIDINRAIESTVVVSTNEWKYVSEVTTHLDRTLPLVPCLPGELNQVILNLIVNAVHAIEAHPDRPAAEKGLIDISTKNLGDRVEIRIADSGTGIPADIADRIFDPFFTTKVVGKGTGQGLALARNIIVNKHAGAISFETAPAKGTTFVVTIPL